MERAREEHRVESARVSPRPCRFDRLWAFTATKLFTGERTSFWWIGFIAKAALSFLYVCRTGMTCRVGFHPKCACGREQRHTTHITATCTRPLLPVGARHKFPMSVVFRVFQSFLVPERSKFPIFFLRSTERLVSAIS